MDEERFFSEDACALSNDAFTALQSLRDDQLHLLDAQSGESISRESLNSLIVSGKYIISSVCHMIKLRLGEILDIDCQRLCPASPDSCFTAPSALKWSKAVEDLSTVQQESDSPLQALFGITEQKVLRSVQDRLKKSLMGGFASCSQLNAAVVSELFCAVNAAVQKTMVKEAWGRSKPLYCRHPFKSCTQTGDEFISSVTTRIEDLTREQGAGNGGAPVTDVKAAVAEVLGIIKDQITESETSEETMFSLDLIEFILNILTVKDEERCCSTASDGSWCSNGSDSDCQSVDLPDFASESEYDDETEEEAKLWTIVRKQGHEDRDGVLMSTLVDTVMKGLGLKGIGYVITLQNLGAAYRRLQDLILEGPTSTFCMEIGEKEQDVVTQRTTTLRNTLASVPATKQQNNKDVLTALAGEFMADFEDEISRCLFLSLFVPRPDSSYSDDVQSLATTCSTTPEGYSGETSECSSEALDDKVTQERSENLDSSLVISGEALHGCVQTILCKIQEVAPTALQKSLLSAITGQQIQELTNSVWILLASATVIRIGKGEHALQELHSSIIDGVYEELLTRMGSVTNMVEAAYTRSEFLCGSLAVSIVRAVLRADPKFTRPREDPPESPASVSSPDHDLMTLLLLRVLSQSEPAPVGCCWRKRSSKSPEDLIERVLLEVSTDSGSERIQTALSGTFDELRQRFGEEGLLRMVMNPQDSNVTDALTQALERHLGGSQAEVEPEKEKKKKKKWSNIFSSLRKLSLFKKKSKEGKKSRSDDGDLDVLPSSSTKKAAPSQEEKQKKGSIFSRMFSSFRKPAA